MWEPWDLTVALTLNKVKRKGLEVLEILRCAQNDNRERQNNKKTNSFYFQPLHLFLTDGNHASLYGYYHCLSASIDIELT